VITVPKRYIYRQTDGRQTDRYILWHNRAHVASRGKKPIHCSELPTSHQRHAVHAYRSACHYCHTICSPSALSPSLSSRL